MDTAVLVTAGCVEGSVPPPAGGKPGPGASRVSAGQRSAEGAGLGGTRTHIYCFLFGLVFSHSINGWYFRNLVPYLHT